MTQLQRLCTWLLVLTCPATLAAGSSRAAVAGAPTPATMQPSPEELRIREAWRTSMLEILPPKKGCFQAAYPSKLWLAVPCTTPPPYPMVPRRGPRTQTVGNGNSLSAKAPTGLISSTTGSFTAVTGVTSESSPVEPSGPPLDDVYTLQINTNYFASPACAGSPNSGCLGWEQFVFGNVGTAGAAEGGESIIFIAYWLLNYNATCPQGWTHFSHPGFSDSDCWKPSLTAAAIPNQAITKLGQLTMTGTVSAGSDHNSLSTGTMLYSMSGENAVNAAAGWKIAEFNVFGAANGTKASFNSGATIIPRTEINYGGTAPPVCTAQGFTEETNNLSFGPTAPAASPPGPALIFTESSTRGARSPCAAATSVGGGACGPNALCLDSGRFEVTATWMNQFNGTSGTAHSIPSTDSTGAFYFTDATNYELIVKILNISGTIKVFYAELTDLMFAITVTDHVSGTSKIYQNTPGDCGAIEEYAIPSGSAALTDAFVKRGSCAPNSSTLCLLNERFAIQVNWMNQFNNTSGQGKPKSLGDESGQFSFTDPTDVELVMKMVDFGDRTGFFYGALSDFEYDITVSDTIGGTTKTYHNAAGNYCGGIDNNAFPP